MTLALDASIPLQPSPGASAGAPAALRTRLWWQAAALMGLSGFAALSYQIIWTQQLSTWLGHEIGAVLAVMSAFFCGLALGGWLLGRRVARSGRPGLWLAGLEAVVGLWALALLVLLPLAGAALTRLIGTDAGPWQQAVWSFAAPALLLLPATVAMGATLPALQRVLAPLREAGHAIGGLYAANTAGAMTGALAAAFWLAPALGLNGSALVAAAASLLCAAGAAWWLRNGTGLPDPASPGAAWGGPGWLGATESNPAAIAPWENGRPGAAADQGLPRLPATPLWRLAATGCLGIGVEVLVVRVLSQVAENTVYTYALLLAVYLLGTAGGAALYQRWLARPTDAERRATQLLLATAAACGATWLVLANAPELKAGFSVLLARGTQAAPSFTQALAAEALLGLCALGLPSLAMGALFSHLAARAHDAGWPLGTALAANTLGAAIAAPLFGVALLPVTGPSALLAGMVAAYGLLMPHAAWRGLWPWSALVAATALLLAGPALRHVEVPPGGRLLSHADGVLGAVSVIEDDDGVRRLHINNREQEGSSATRLADARQAWLPLLLHPAPQRTLFLGLGTGVTASSAVSPGLQVQAVELLPEVAQAARWFVPALARTDGGRPPLGIHVGDARRHMRASTETQDVIVADLFHPARSGAAALFTAEHFAAVRDRLAPGGLFCQWLPVHQLDLDSLRSIVAAYLQVFPDAVAVLATHSLDTPVLGLVGRAEGGTWAAASLASRLVQARGTPNLAGLQLDDPWAVPGAVLADADALARWAGAAPANRDDLPLVGYRAPRLRDTPTDGPRQRLSRLVQDLRAEPARVFGTPRDAAEAAWQQRLADYWRARNHHLLAGMSVRPTPDLKALLSQVQAPLLATLRISPDFRPAYDPLLRMAQALAQADPAAARELLLALQAAQPARPEAGLALQALPTAPTEPASTTPLQRAARAASPAHAPR